MKMKMNSDERRHEKIASMKVAPANALATGHRVIHLNTIFIIIAMLFIASIIHPHNVS